MKSQDRITNLQFFKEKSKWNTKDYIKNKENFAIVGLLIYFALNMFLKCTKSIPDGHNGTLCELWTAWGCFFWPRDTGAAFFCGSDFSLALPFVRISI